jgi:hypothetical protein
MKQCSDPDKSRRCGLEQGNIPQICRPLVAIQDGEGPRPPTLAQSPPPFVLGEGLFHPMMGDRGSLLAEFSARPLNNQGFADGQKAQLSGISTGKFSTLRCLVV